MDNKYDDDMVRLDAYFLREHIPISRETIGEFEDKLGYYLPDDYRHFLEKYGFATGKGYVSFPDIDRPGKSGGGLEVFYGINAAVSRDLLRQKKGLGGRIPDNMLPVASSPGGQVCLCLEGIHFGKVFMWDRCEPFAEPVKNLHLIGYSWDTFVKSLDKSAKWKGDEG